MEVHYGYPFRGEALEEMRRFLNACGIGYDEGVDFSVCIMDGGRIAAAGSLDGGVLKCIAVSPDYQGEGLAAQVTTELVNQAARKGFYHLFIFTKPENLELFGSLGFYPIAETGRALLMENRKNGIADYVLSLRKGDTDAGPAGCIVANCNPFTRGHLYLIESAARRCGLVHLFILSEDKSEFPTEARRLLVQRGTAHLSNVIVQPAGPYIISAATFPSYFYKEPSLTAEANGELDLKIFCERVARPLGITRRFVGTEPFSPLTDSYNALMKKILPGYGIELIELPRITDNRDGRAVSASRVRALLREGRLTDVKELVPQVTWEYLTEHYQDPFNG
ncbi:MAG: [citrate (pro-3S)-lyase] ligase [Treponema sp.]|jgi:[citrate (pro-3S)-lyase] ligase|nr:[citrate (pro-3S)-lyase] ligase [Treponema sp.]